MYQLSVTPDAVECRHAADTFVGANPAQVAAAMIRAGLRDDCFEVRIEHVVHLSGSSLLSLAGPVLVMTDPPVAPLLIPIPKSFHDQVLVVEKPGQQLRLSRVLDHWCTAHLASGWGLQTHTFRHADEPAPARATEPFLTVTTVEDMVRFRERWFDTDMRRQMQRISDAAIRTRTTQSADVAVVSAWNLTDFGDRREEGLVLLLRSNGATTFQFSHQWRDIGHVTLCPDHLLQLVAMTPDMLGAADDMQVMKSCGGGPLQIGFLREEDSPLVQVALLDPSQPSNPQMLAYVPRGRLVGVLDEAASVIDDLLNGDSEAQEAAMSDLPQPTAAGNDYRH